MWVLLLACAPPVAREDEEPGATAVGLTEGAVSAVDVDEDGALSDVDCDDFEPRALPGAVEVCDHVDNDCDGDVDEDLLETFWADVDGDGWGTEGIPIHACELPVGASDRYGDCDEGDDRVNPGAEEVCDGVDQDCDREVDEGVAMRLYRDADRDGHGDPELPLDRCDEGPGEVVEADDCDDGDANAFPGADEVCGGRDEDCDGEVDEADAADAPTWFADADGDGWGDASLAATACLGSLGTVTADGDCDDADPAVSPGALEVCGGVDEDCDGTLDEDDALDASTWYTDADLDGFGDATAPLRACAPGVGEVADATDCDDADARAFPGADERCDGTDDDCDGAVDEGAVDALSWYTDTDGDAFGDSATARAACVATSTEVDEGGDCDEADAAVNPLATETCDEADNDCDGEVDEADAADARTWFADADGDGFGDAGAPSVSCEAGPGEVPTDTDCDDADERSHPGADERCDDVDNDCDGTADDNPVDPTTWYGDGDDDGYGTASSTVTACDAPARMVATPGDCEDVDPDVHPDATEVCADAADQDCDGDVDEAPCVQHHCGTVSANETWSTGDAHLVTCDVTVTAGTLTVQDGVTVAFDPGTRLVVSAGRLEVDGDATGVTFHSSAASPARGDWAGVRVARGGAASLTGLTVTEAGNGLSGALYVEANDVTLDRVEVWRSSSAGLYARQGSVTVVDSTFSDNAGKGVDVANGSLAGSFTGNVVTGNGGVPLALSAASLPWLDDDNTLSGNAVDTVEVGGGTVAQDATLHDFGVPYWVTGSVYVQSGTAPTLTVEEAVTVEMARATALYVGVGNRGRLVARPGVVFTSAQATPAAGDWRSLWFGPLDAGSALSGAEVAYGGMDYGAVVFWYTPTGASVDACTVHDSATYGIYRQSSSPALSGVGYAGNASGDLY